MTVVLIGLGNIGSQCIPSLARMPGVTRVVLVDRDTYEATNLGSQAISPRDVGKPKAIAQGHRLRALNLSIGVEAIVDDVAMIPPGRLRGNIILTGLDSVEARVYVSEIAWRLGVPWLDAGIEPEQRLVRVTGYLPAPGSPCYACGLDDAEYRELAARHPCRPLTRQAVPTNAPATLGALAADLLAIECEKILTGDSSHALLGRQLVLDTLNHRHFVTALRRNSRCRFDHVRWRLGNLPPLPVSSSLGELMECARRAAKGGADAWIKVEQWPLARAAHCLRCSGKVERVHVVRHPFPCPHCARGEMRATGFTLIDQLDRQTPGAILRKPLRTVGLLPGDVVRVTSGRRVRRFVIYRKTL